MKKWIKLVIWTNECLKMNGKWESSKTGKILKIIFFTNFCEHIFVNTILDKFLNKNSKPPFL
mgnify:CR=1 FL=1